MILYLGQLTQSKEMHFRLIGLFKTAHACDGCFVTTCHGWMDDGCSCNHEYNVVFVLASVRLNYDLLDSATMCFLFGGGVSQTLNLSFLTILDGMIWVCRCDEEVKGGVEGLNGRSLTSFALSLCPR